jgi:hypothetical protein
MRAMTILLILGTTGCSTAPVAGLLDRFYPGGVRARDFETPNGSGDGSGIGIGPPRPIDPLVESPGLSIPNNPPSSPPVPAPSPVSPPSNDNVVPPPTIGRSTGDLGRTAAFQRSDAKK